jgi:hypothetical protein
LIKEIGVNPTPALAVLKTQPYPKINSPFTVVVWDPLETAVPVPVAEAVWSTGETVARPVHSDT